jgi:hypothetical protein
VANATVAQILEGLRVRLDTIAGLHAHAEQPDVILTPAAWPSLVGIEYDDTLDATDLLKFEVNVAAAPAQGGLAKGYAATYLYLASSGAKSLKAALEADVTLGGLVDTLVVADSAAVGAYQAAGLAYIGGKLTVNVYT